MVDDVASGHLRRQVGRRENPPQETGYLEQRRGQLPSSLAEVRAQLDQL